MVYREVWMVEIKEVLRLWLEGAPKKRIARQMGMDPKTVRRCVRAAEAGGLTLAEGPSALTEERFATVLLTLRVRPERMRGEAWAVCGTYRERIRTLLDRRIRLTKIRKLLARDGIVIPYPTLRRFAVAELGFGLTAATVAVADGEPGQEIQLDTGWMAHLVPDERGRRRRFRAWIFTAVLSRHRFVYPCHPETTESAIEACEAAWEFFGGIFVVLLPDNTKAIVQTADPLDPKINPTFLEYAQDRGFHIDPTRVRKPRDKARVERAVPTVRDDCFAGEVLLDLDHARRHARSWCLEQYGIRIHTRTYRRPLEHFEAAEKSCLLPPPTRGYDIPIWSDPKVARDHFAQVTKALYSLPTRFIGKILRARADHQTVRFYDAGVLVKTHPRQAAGGRSTDPTDFPPHKSAYAMRDIAFLARQAAGHGPSIGRFASTLLEGPLPWTRMRRVYTLLGLAKKYGNARVEEACAAALAVDMIDIKRLQRMLEKGRPLVEAPAPSKVFPFPRHLRPKEHFAPRASRPEDSDAS